jgi:hypothetical protein
MKRFALGMCILLMLAIGVVAYAQGPGMMGGGYGMGPGMMGSGQQQGWNYCPTCGQYLGQGGYGMMGPGMMGSGQGMMGMMHGGYGMGSGMMGGGYGMGPGMMRGGMGPGMMGQGYYGQNPDCQKFLDDTSDLRKDFHSKKFEYMETFRNPKATPESVTELQNELNKIYGEIQSKAPQGCWAQ